MRFITLICYYCGYTLVISESILINILFYMQPNSPYPEIIIFYFNLSQINGLFLYFQRLINKLMSLLLSILPIFIYPLERDK